MIDVPLKYYQTEDYKFTLRKFRSVTISKFPQITFTLENNAVNENKYTEDKMSMRKIGESFHLYQLCWGAFVGSRQEERRRSCLLAEFDTRNKWLGPRVTSTSPKSKQIHFLFWKPKDIFGGSKINYSYVLCGLMTHQVKIESAAIRNVVAVFRNTPVTNLAPLPEQCTDLYDASNPETRLR